VQTDDLAAAVAKFVRNNAMLIAETFRYQIFTVYSRHINEKMARVIFAYVLWFKRCHKTSAYSNSAEGRIAVPLSVGNLGPM